MKIKAFGLLPDIVDDDYMQHAYTLTARVQNIFR